MKAGESLGGAELPGGPGGGAVAALREALRVGAERWPREELYLVGVSGGVDSVVLLRGLQECGYERLVVCHLDHGLRGDAGAADARWVEGLAGELGFAWEGERRDVGAAAAAAGISVETAGRRARHALFAAAARQHGVGRVFLGHHADDQAETVLMNLCRGSAGLAGMAGETELAVAGLAEPLRLLRPLLGLPKRVVREVAAARGWEYREDASNAVAEVVRNRVRLEVLPLLDAIFQRPVAPGMARAAGWAEGAREYLRQAAAGWVGQERLRTAEVAGLDAALRDSVLAGWLRARGVPDVSAALVAQAGAMLDPATGPSRWNAPGNTFLRRRGGWLWVERVPACGTGAG